MGLTRQMPSCHPSIRPLSSLRGGRRSLERSAGAGFLHRQRHRLANVDNPVAAFTSALWFKDGTDFQVKPRPKAQSKKQSRLRNSLPARWYVHLMGRGGTAGRSRGGSLHAVGRQDTAVVRVFLECRGLRGFVLELLARTVSPGCWMHSTTPRPVSRGADCQWH